MFSHMLIPVALDHKADVKRALDLSERLLAEDGQITLLHVMEAIPAYVEVQIAPEVLKQNRDTAMNELLEVATGRTARVGCEVISGHAGRSILDFAQSAAVDCIAILSHDPGLQDYFLGSTAARVVRHAHCSVLVIR